MDRRDIKDIEALPREQRELIHAGNVEKAKIYVSVTISAIATTEFIYFSHYNFMAVDQWTDGFSFRFGNQIQKS